MSEPMTDTADVDTLGEDGGDTEGTTEQPNGEDGGTNGGAEPGTSRDRSTIKFPYTDIRDAVAVAVALKTNWGSECKTEDLAAAMKQKVSSGSFRTKVSTANIFGAIESKRGTITLTALGAAMTDPKTRDAALATAFLTVELYQKIYDKYRGTTLPGDTGLEVDIQREGVLPSQVDRARQAMQRSAQHAGYFWQGTDRLVQPSTVKIEGHQETQPVKHQQPKVEPEGGTKLSEAPLLKALWETLPADKNFTAEQRKRFFTTLAFNIDYVYGPPSDGRLDPEGIANLWKTESP